MTEGQSRAPRRRGPEYSKYDAQDSAVVETAPPTIFSAVIVLRCQHEFAPGNVDRRFD